MTPMISRLAEAIAGEVSVAGDKSISHRALILGATAVGESRVSGLLEAEDVSRTAAALGALGVIVEPGNGGAWRVIGRGVGGLAEPEGVLDMGNSGTGARLLMGLVAAHPFTSIFSGDASLRKRPMNRVMDPLRKMGAAFATRAGGLLPVTVTGTESPQPIEYELPVASAQVKSAVLLAGLNAPGRTTIVEPRASRDHTERMLAHYGAEIVVKDLPGGGRGITLTGQPEISAQDVTVPGDFSSAAFPIVAALLAPESTITLRGVGVNPLRSGLLDTLGEMGAAVGIANRRDESAEPVADLTVESSPLHGVEVPAERAPAMIDEYPILAVAAAFAQGTTRMLGLSELRVKESDRLAAMAKGLEACGVKVKEDADSLTIHGSGRPPRGGAAIAVDMDHRVAMAFLVLGMAAKEPVRVDDASCIGTSFPGFAEAMNELGARIEAVS